ncbi:hypothetical protein GTV15_19015 [Streptomyces sp. SID7803]|nr:hypothetical protein [Streptomyces sp. SID7803]
MHELFSIKPRGFELERLTESSNRAVTAIFDVPIDGDIDAEEARVRRGVTVVSEPYAPDRAQGHGTRRRPAGQQSADYYTPDGDCALLSSRRA